MLNEGGKLHDLVTLKKKKDPSTDSVENELQRGRCASTVQIIVGSQHLAMIKSMTEATMIWRVDQNMEKTWDLW